MIKIAISFLAISLELTAIVVAKPAIWQAHWRLLPDGRIVDNFSLFPLGRWQKQNLQGDRLNSRIVVHLLIVNDAYILIASESIVPSRLPHSEFRPIIELSFSSWRPITNITWTTYNPDGSIVVDLILVQNFRQLKEKQYVPHDLQQMRRKVYSLGMVSFMWQMPIGEN